MTNKNITNKTKILLAVAGLIAMISIAGMYAYNYYFIDYPERWPWYVCCEESWKE